MFTKSFFVSGFGDDTAPPTVSLCQSDPIQSCSPQRRAQQIKTRWCLNQTIITPSTSPLMTSELRFSSKMRIWHSISEATAVRFYSERYCEMLTECEG